MKKVIGYVLALVGLIVLASGIKGFDVFILKFFPFLGNLPTFKGISLSLIGGLVLIVLGIIFLKGSGRGRQATEVPIYSGKHIVGYRRHK